VHATPKSDLWRKTHYGFIHDNGNFYYTTIDAKEGNTSKFQMSVTFDGKYLREYDQSGLMIRFNSHYWLKTGIEFFAEGYSTRRKHASAVFTNEYSAWSVARLPDYVTSLTIRLRKDKEAVLIDYLAHSDEQDYKQTEPQLLAMGYLVVPEQVLKEVQNQVQVGIMTASPTNDDGFETVFSDFKLELY